MKYNTIMDYPHRGTLQRFTETTNTSGVTVRSYYNAEEIRFKLIGPRSGLARITLYSEQQLRTFERVRDIVDPDGRPVLMDGISGYEINAIYPVMNPFGYRDGFMYTLARLVQ